MNCPVCAQGPVAAGWKYCSPKCRWTVKNQKRYTRPERSCPGCSTDLTDRHGATKYCSEACRRWVSNGHTDLRVQPTACVICGNSLAGKRVNAQFCNRACKMRAAESRRVRDDGARYLLERHRRIAYAIAYAKVKPHVGQAARVRRKAWKRDAGVFQVTGEDWRRLCDRHDRRCVYCSRRRPLTMDHVIPLSRGGRHSIGNLLPACASCNASKSNRFLVEWKLATSRG